jgi:hypothetical protein
MGAENDLMPARSWQEYSMIGRIDAAPLPLK